MLSTLHGCSSKFRHVEITPSAFQWTDDRNERTSQALRFYSAWYFGNGITTNLQRITGVTGTIKINFHCSGTYTNPSQYFPNETSPFTAAFARLSYVRPNLSSGNVIELVKSGFACPITTNSNGYVTLDAFFGDLDTTKINQFLLSTRVNGGYVKINYPDGGIDSTKYYVVKNATYVDLYLSFRLTDLDGNDVVLTNTSGTTSSVTNTLFPDYYVSGEEPSGRPVRGSWGEPFDTIFLKSGDNFVDVTNGVYIWFVIFRGMNDPPDRTCRIYNETFFNRRGYSAEGQSYQLSNIFSI